MDGQPLHRPIPATGPLPGALGEYNGKFMCNQMVLRGGSCATPRSHIRADYRNFFPPRHAGSSAGMRLAERLMKTTASEAEIPIALPDGETQHFRADVLRGPAPGPQGTALQVFLRRDRFASLRGICELKEYYLTRTELLLMQRYAAEMAALLGPDCLLIEFGSGSSLKTRLLLDHLPRPAGYVPVDMSCEHLRASPRR